MLKIAAAPVEAFLKPRHHDLFLIAAGAEGMQRTPSATSPASRNAFGPTAASVIGTIGRPIEGGTKFGVISVKV